MSWTRVGTPVSNSAPGGSTTVSVSYSPTAGNTVVIWGFSDAGVTITSVTDNAGGGSSNYSSIFNLINGEGNTNAMFFCDSVNSGVSSITMTSSVGGHLIIIAAEYLASGSKTNEGASSSVSGSGTTQTSNSLTVASALSLLLLGYFHQATDDTTTFSATAPMSLILNQGETGAGTLLGATDQIIASSSTSYTADATTGGVVGWRAYVVGISEQLAGPGSGSDLSLIGMSESSANLIRVSIIEETA